MLSHKDRVAILHSLTPIEMIKKTDVGEKPLLLYSAFYNSPVSTLYLLQRGANLWDEDNEGKSIFHLCAYTGHV
jgi:ankyrin repeat protein